MLRKLLLIVVAGCVVGCQTVQTTAPGAVGVTRQQRVLVSDEQVQAGAAQAYAQQLQQARAKGILNTDEQLTSRVRNITQRLIAQTPVFREDALQWNWEVNTFETEELNAFAMPGGKIAVYSGLAERLELTDAELAAVIGHEIAHALREHAAERISRQYAQQIALTGAAILAGAQGGLLDLANMVATVTFQLPHTREQEAEADLIGLELMARAGYDPQAAVRVWEKMRKAQEGSPPEFLSTHPSPETRIERLQATIPKVMPLYRGARS